MQVIHKTSKRTITEKEALRLKKIEPFSTFRQDAKAVNFGMIFGMSFKKFSKTSLETSWSENRIDSFIENMKLQESVEEMKERYIGEDEKIWKYYAVAKFIRTQFFDTYVGLMERIKRNEAFAKEHGYIRSRFGAIRRLPMLSLCCTENKEGKQILRPQENMKEVAELVNISSNSTIQTDEVCIIMQCKNDWNHSQKGLFCEATVPTSGMVHDSSDFYVPKDDPVDILVQIKKTFEKDEKWQLGIKFLTDMTIVDIIKGEYYKNGTSYGKFLRAQKEKIDENNS
jgi:hypothetical protein